jgi:septum formation protein
MTTATAAGRTFVLASASPRRRELLTALGFKVSTDPSTIPEPERKPGESAAVYVVRAARVKAREVAARHANGLIIGADTIVVTNDLILGKPASADEARRMLRNLSGRWHEVFTGICLIDNVCGRSGSACSRSRVHMRRLAQADIDWYLSTGEYRDKAGAYAVQGYASLFIDRIEGCYFNIVGFPISTFAELCRRLGIPPRPHRHT